MTNVDPALRRTWLPLAWSAQLADAPLRSWLLGEPYVVFRGERGPVVLPDRCPHRLAPLSRGVVVDGSLRCAYHGWTYDPSGRCSTIPTIGPFGRIPQKAHLAAPFGVCERYGIVFVALEQPVADVIDLPHCGEAATRRVAHKEAEDRFGALQLIDNQLDASHFAFVHRMTFGSESAAAIARYEVVGDDDGWGFSYRLAVPIAHNRPAGADGSDPRLGTVREMTYRFRAGLQLSLELRYPESGGVHSIGFFVQPETEERSRMFVTSVLDQPGGFTEGEYAARQEFESRIGAEDRALQRAFDVLALPRRADVECHARADRASLEFRRVLRRLVSDGVAPAATSRFVHPAGAANRPRALELVPKC